MAKKRGSNWKNSNQIEEVMGASYFHHYRRYLESLAYQLFEWKNLPEGVNPSYLEKRLHQFGYIAFYDDPSKGYLVTQGALGGELNHYDEPTRFTASAPRYTKSFPLYTYGSTMDKKKGVIIYNNDMHYPTIPSLRMFARDLAETKQVTKTNILQQKTPHIFLTDDSTKLSMMNLMNQIEGNAVAILADKGLDLDNLRHFPVVAPFVADKLNAHRGNIWNEAMTFLSINNANLEKRERQITSEVESINEQLEGSGNIYLKSRKEACEIINEMHGLNISVDYRKGAIEALQSYIKNDLGGVQPWQAIQSN
ncbi:upper collar connector [Bacillus phage BeachBum]|uniref:Upper collar protein n=1 Tax=Bacillus phage BeachBum TaxID=1983461 RepID=A0A1X9SGN4_9CAUD|nr:upper collar connector [Bacillus phage BeachBum]ARQ95221.1 upper collar protein [Bacillus phage BeachBum]